MTDWEGQLDRDGYAVLPAVFGPGEVAGLIADCGRARELAIAAPDGELEARVHFALGTIYSRRALYRQSVAETERALALERRHGRSPNQLAGVLNSMGVEYAAVGRLTEAATSYEEGLRLARSLADTSTAAVIISAIVDDAVGNADMIIMCRYKNIFIFFI